MEEQAIKFPRKIPLANTLDLCWQDHTVYVERSDSSPWFITPSKCCHLSRFEFLSTRALTQWSGSREEIRIIEELDYMAYKQSLKCRGFTEWISLEGTTEGYLIQPPCSGRVPSLQNITQDWGQMIFEYLHGWRLHNISEIPVVVLVQHKKVSPDVQREPLCFSLSPVPHVWLQHTSEKSLAPSLHSLSADTQW